MAENENVLPIKEKEDGSVIAAIEPDDDHLLGEEAEEPKKKKKDDDHDDENVSIVLARHEAKRSVSIR